MSLEREVHDDVRTMLIDNEPFQYAHLIKFERPSRPDSISGKVSTSASRYTYITDASREVPFDDGSTDLDGNPNGSQVYVANKVLNVSALSESTEAKPSNFTLTLDGNGIGALAYTQNGQVTISGNDYFIYWPSTIDLVDLGFREGDKVIFSGSKEGEVNIVKFVSGNGIKCSPVEGTTWAGDIASGAELTMALASEEIKSVLMDKNAEEYASFINREVFIYRAYFQDGLMVGATPDGNGVRGPILLFKGIISNVDFSDEEDGIKVQWGLTSHWGDFAQVRGRITSDEFHRALDSNGVPQPESAIKPIYAYDKGFTHADTSINLLATYSVQVEKQDIKVKKGFLGIGAKVKVKKYFVNEARNTNLDFQLASKSIPVIYGVRNVTGIPVFADTKKTDSATVYVVYVLSEGQIGGLYDLYVNGKSLVCNDQADFDARATQNSDNTVDIICRGRADRGDVLGGDPAVNPNSTPIYYYEDIGAIYSGLGYDTNWITHYQPYVEPTNEPIVDADAAGVIDGETIKLTSPMDLNITFYSGTEEQAADSELVAVAKAGDFKVQTDYWSGNDTSEYWGPNHRLIDSAYVTLKAKIKEGETTIPDLEFIARGKVLSCYNYDYSYAPYTKPAGHSAHTNFLLGETVDLCNAADDSVINSNVQIIDKWSFVRPDGVVEVRFRWSATPALGYVDGVPTITKFYMKKGAFKWYMTTFNYVEYTVTAGAAIASTISGVNNIGGEAEITYGNNPDLTVGGTPGGGGGGPALSIFENDRPVTTTVFGPAIIQGDVSATGVITRHEYSRVINELTDLL